MIGDVHYLNSGDWVESLTAVVEHLDGRYELIEFTDFVRRYPMPRDEPAGDEPAADEPASEGPGPGRAAEPVESAEPVQPAAPAAVAGVAPARSAAGPSAG
jgi:hypothetical protein